jgi:hypothetical protein
VKQFMPPDSRQPFTDHLLISSGLRYLQLTTFTTRAITPMREDMVAIVFRHGVRTCLKQNGGDARINETMALATPLDMNSILDAV